jgi:hypothetical protein
VSSTFAGVITFSKCNMAGATYTLSNPSPLQVQFALCLNLPTTRPTNATYGTANADTTLAITTDTTFIRVNNSVGTAGQVLTSDGPSSPAYWSTVVGQTGPTGPTGPAAVSTIYGQMSNQNPQSVEITTTGVYVPMTINGTFDSTNSSGTTAPTTASFGIKNTSGSSKLFVVIATADVAIGNNKTAGFRLAKDGIEIAETECTASTGTFNFAKLMTQWFVRLDHNQEVSMFIANLTDTNNISVNRSKVIAYSIA